MPIIDVDAPATWPLSIRTKVRGWADSCKGTTNYAQDLMLPTELEEPFCQLFSGYLVRAYHCTRLMAHEVEMIVTHGLRPLSANLLTERIEAGHGKGLISATEAKAFHRAHVFATGEEGGREGQVCLILSKRQFEYNLEGCLPLLSTWGGEGIYRSSVAFRIKEKLGRLGSPAVVVARLQLGGDGPRPLMFPSLHKVFVGALLGLADTGADVFYRAPVPPENIEFVLQPGTDAYSRLGDLPLF